MAQICPNCSTSNADDATLCKKCANPLPGAVAVNANSNGAPKVSTGATPPRRPAPGAVAEAARRAAAQQKAAQAPTSTPGTTGTGTSTTRFRPASTTTATGAGSRGLPGTAKGPVTRTLNKALDDAGLPRFSTQRYMIIWLGVLLVIVVVFALLIYSGGASSQTATPTPVVGAATAGNFAGVETAKGNFKIQLTTDASVSDVVKNFKDRVASGFYDGLTFHSVTADLVQGGDPKGDGTGGSSIVAQYNSTPFNRGAIGMASQAKRSTRVNDSQWFIVKKDSPTLTDQYPNFGQVIEGMDVVDKLTPGDKITKITLAEK